MIHLASDFVDDCLIQSLHSKEFAKTLNLVARWGCTSELSVEEDNGKYKNK